MKDRVKCEKVNDLQIMHQTSWKNTSYGWNAGAPLHSVAIFHSWFSTHDCGGARTARRSSTTLVNIDRLLSADAATAATGTGSLRHLESDLRQLSHFVESAAASPFIHPLTSICPSCLISMTHVAPETGAIFDSFSGAGFRRRFLVPSIRLEWKFLAPKINVAESDVDDEFSEAAAIIKAGL